MNASRLKHFSIFVSMWILLFKVLVGSMVWYHDYMLHELKYHVLTLIRIIIMMNIRIKFNMMIIVIMISTAGMSRFWLYGAFSVRFSLFLRSFLIGC